MTRGGVPRGTRVDGRHGRGGAATGVRPPTDALAGRRREHRRIVRVLMVLTTILASVVAPVTWAPATTPGPQVLGAAELKPADPDLAIAPSGAQVIAFTGRSDSGFAVLTRSRARAGGPWGPAVRVSRVARTRPADPAVAIDPRGAAVVIWRPPGEPVRSAVRRSAGAAWTRLAIADGPAGSTRPPSPWPTASRRPPGSMEPDPAGTRAERCSTSARAGGASRTRSRSAVRWPSRSGTTAPPLRSGPAPTPGRAVRMRRRMRRPVRWAHRATRPPRPAGSHP